MHDVADMTFLAVCVCNCANSDATCFWTMLIIYMIDFAAVASLCMTLYSFVDIKFLGSVFLQLFGTVHVIDIINK